MARSKTLSKAPVLRTGENPATDFTFNEINRCTIRFNKAAVVYLEYDSTNERVSIVVENEIAGTTKTLSGTVTGG